VNFLLCKPGHIGDVLLLTPTIRFLRDRFPEARIDVVVRRGTEGVLDGNPDLSRLFLLPGSEDERGRGARRLRDTVRLVRGVVGQRYDYAFDFANSDRSRLWMLLAGAKERCAHNAYGELKGKAHFYTFHSPFPWGPEHQALKDFRLVADALNVPGEPGPLVINTDLDAAPIRQRFPFLAESGPWVVIHPTSRWPFKQWLPDRWAAVAACLAETWGLRVVLSCGPDPREGEHLDQILRHAARPYPCIRGQATLRELAWILRQARLFCGVDTVAMHIAAAARTPVVALFGPSSEWSWRPWQTTHELALGPCSCKATRRFVCDKSRPYPCMEAITTSDVVDRIGRLLAGNSPGLRELHTKPPARAGPEFA
jgi:heptosyltransferase III